MGNLHAIILILLPIVTAVLCVRFCRRSPPPSQAAPPDILASAGRSPVTGRKLRNGRSVPGILGEILACTVFGFLVASLSAQDSLAGQAVTQLLIPWVCLLAVVLFMTDRRVRLLLAAALAVLMIGLTGSYTGLVHGPTYVGNPGYGRMRERRLANELDRASKALAELGQWDHDVYPGGWLSELPAYRSHKEDRALRFAVQWQRIEVRPFWHSWLTGLYRRVMADVEMWYPGGRLRDAGGKLEYRER